MTSAARRSRICTAKGYAQHPPPSSAGVPDPSDCSRYRRVACRERSSNRRSDVEVPKDTIVSMIESRAGSDQAQQAAEQLPDIVDHQEHGGLLQQFGIDPHELA